MTSRRQALRFLGGSAVALAAATGLGACALVVTREPKRAQLPWRIAAEGDFADPRLKALAYAVLAPNPHNRQPWLLDLVGDDTVDVYCELDRRLPETDPFDRQIVIGFGAFLELLRMAAANDGRSVTVTPFPDGAPGLRLDARPVARVRFDAGGASSDPLFAHVLARRTCREPFDMEREVPDAALANVRRAAVAAQSVSVSHADPLRASLRALTWRAHELEIRTPVTYQESINVMRIGRREIEANPDGISLQGAFLEVLNAAGILTRETIADPSTAAFQQGLDRFVPVFASAMAHVWVTTPGNTRIEQLGAGRDWLRMNLAATREGVALQPLSQALQEFPEMAELYAEAHELLAPDGGRVQMLGRLGFGSAVTPAPRWPLESRLKDV